MPCMAPENATRRRTFADDDWFSLTWWLGGERGRPAGKIGESMKIQPFVALAAALSISLSTVYPRALFAEEDADPRGGVPGACCDPETAACSIRDETSCLAIGGVFAGEGTTCDACIDTSITLQITALEDTFELMAAPEACYGTAGALNVSGSQARNNQNQVRGITDSWMKFDLSGPGLFFDENFGSENWDIVSIQLKLREFTTPVHNIFGIGSGRFLIKWLANDNWIEGTGRPIQPGSVFGNRIGFTYGRSLLNSAADETLGIFQNALVNGYQTFDLNLPGGLINDIKTGSPVSFYFTSVDLRTGFTFYSASHFDPPVLVVTADFPQPPCTGDLNGDRRVRGDDIPLFTEGFLSPGGLSAWEFDRIDMNASGTLEAADVDCFAQALLATQDCLANGPFVCP